MDIWEDQTVEARKERWKALWALEDLPRPLWFVPASPMLAAVQMYGMQRLPIDELFTNRELQYEVSMTVNARGKTSASLRNMAGNNISPGAWNLTQKLHAPTPPDTLYIASPKAHAARASASRANSSFSLLRGFL